MQTAKNSTHIMRMKERAGQTLRLALIRRHSNYYLPALSGLVLRKRNYDLIYITVKPRQYVHRRAMEIWSSRVVITEVGSNTYQIPDLSETKANET